MLPIPLLILLLWIVIWINIVVKENGSLSKKLLGRSSIKINLNYAGLIQVGLFFFKQIWGCLVNMFKHMFLVFKQYYTHFHTLFHLYVFSHMFSNRDGNGVGRGRRLGSSFLPPMVLSCLIPASHDEENFLTPSPPLGTPQASPHKTLLFVNLSYD